MPCYVCEIFEYKSMENKQDIVYIKPCDMCKESHRIYIDDKLIKGREAKKLFINLKKKHKIKVIKQDISGTNNTNWVYGHCLNDNTQIACYMDGKRVKNFKKIISEVIVYVQ